jgi:dihydropyrimidinase
MIDLVITNGRIVLPDQILKTSIAVDNGKIVAIGSNASMVASERVINAKDNFVLPGGVDTHDHTLVNKGFAGTKGMSWGGTTTTLRFTRVAFEEINAHLAEMSDFVVDHSFHVVLPNISPETPHALDDIPKWIAFGVPSFKLFMVYENFADENTVYHALQQCKEFGGLLTLHAENQSMVDYNRSLAVNEGNNDAIYHALTRPPVTEAAAVNLAVYFASYLKTPYMNMHLSIKEGVNILREARKNGALVYGETCPQYLSKTQDALKGPHGIYHICTPPFRTQEHIEALWHGLNDGTLSTVGSDHVSHLTSEKQGHRNFTEVPNGCPGHEFRLAVLFSEGVRKGRISLNRLSEIYSTNAAKIYGLYPRKGIINVGSDADLVIFDPQQEKTATHKELDDLGIADSDWCAYEGTTFMGWPRVTILKGQIQWENGEFKGKRGDGEFLKRHLSPELFQTIIA